jgi:ribosomal protein S18 acetylase RimI-like enzyme
MIRPLLPADTPNLLRLAERTGVFKPVEVVALEEVLDEYHASNRAAGHRAVGVERDGSLAGFAYFAPASMTEGTWYLWWIAVDKDVQGGGIGGALLRHAEEESGQHTGRQLLIETSSLPHYELTRRFYLKHGYRQVAVLPDYYAEGDDMVVFGKRLGEGCG